MFFEERDSMWIWYNNQIITNGNVYGNFASDAKKHFIVSYFYRTYIHTHIIV